MNNLLHNLLDFNRYCIASTLIDRELVFYKYLIIMEYLDKRFPHPSLMLYYLAVRGERRLMMQHCRQNDCYNLMLNIEQLVAARMLTLSSATARRTASGAGL